MTQPDRSYVLIGPCRNEAKYMERTLASVAAQTVKPAKFIIVDDGSDDETPEIAARYAAEHDFIEVIDSYIDPPSIDIPFVGKMKMPIVASRRFLVAQWRRYDQKGGQWTLIAQTLPPDLRVDPRGQPRYPHREGYEHSVDAVGFSGVVAREDPYNPQGACYVTSVVHLSPGGLIPDSAVKWYKTRMMERLETYEKACQDEAWFKYGYPKEAPAIKTRVAH